jgi:hypothetical protein
MFHTHLSLTHPHRHPLREIVCAAFELNRNDSQQLYADLCENKDELNDAQYASQLEHFIVLATRQVQSVDDLTKLLKQLSPNTSVDVLQQIVAHVCGMLILFCILFVLFIDWTSFDELMKVAKKCSFNKVDMIRARMYSLIDAKEYDKAIQFNNVHLV